MIMTRVIGSLVFLPQEHRGHRFVLCPERFSLQLLSTTNLARSAEDQDLLPKRMVPELRSMNG
jgi:hypothetical protein